MHLFSYRVSAQDGAGEQVHHAGVFLIVLSDRRDSNPICVGSLHLLWMDKRGFAVLIGSEERWKT